EGVFTAMPMRVAEELDCDWNQVKAEYASANRSVRENGVYKRMGTGGSGAVRRSREYLQQAGASARERLKAAAAARWEVPVAELRTEGGEVFHDASGRRTAYGVLAAEAAAITLAEEPPIRKAGEFKLLGTPLNRLDVPSKVDGSATFGVHGRASRPSPRSGTWARTQAQAAMPCGRNLRATLTAEAWSPTRKEIPTPASKAQKRSSKQTTTPPIWRTSPWSR
ncbi:MAG: molybdopterin cofactor-binding domain-containing protein, partial [Pseudomonadales bacterium]